MGSCHILLLHFYQNPTPDYPNLAAALRARGHTVWLGARDHNGDLEWHDGQQVVALQTGPASVPSAIARMPVLRVFAQRILFLGFMLRLRSFVRWVRPDFVQVNPASLKWLAILPALMPGETRFILDIKQINLGRRSDWGERVRDWHYLQSRRIWARCFYDHTCFDHALAAQRILGKEWQRWATVIPVGLHPSFLGQWPALRAAAPGDAVPVRFVYVGTIAAFRELGKLLQAAQRLVAEADGFRIDFLGPDLTDGYYRQMAGQLGLGGAIAFRPPVANDQVAGIVADYDVALAYVPVRAGFHLQPSMKILEFRALGLPILATDLMCNREVVQHEVNGLLVPDSIDGLAGGMRRFVQDRAFLQRCRSHAQVMRRGITLDQVAEAHETQVYQRLQACRQDL